MGLKIYVSIACLFLAVKKAENNKINDLGAHRRTAASVAVKMCIFSFRVPIPTSLTWNSSSYQVTETKFLEQTEVANLL